MSLRIHPNLRPCTHLLRVSTNQTLPTNHTPHPTAHFSSFPPSAVVVLLLIRSYSRDDVSCIPCLFTIHPASSQHPPPVCSLPSHRTATSFLHSKLPRRDDELHIRPDVHHQTLVVITFTSTLLLTAIEPPLHSKPKTNYQVKVIPLLRSSSSTCRHHQTLPASQICHYVPPFARPAHTSLPFPSGFSPHGWQNDVASTCGCGGDCFR